MRSLRASLIIGTTAGVAIVLVVAGVLLYLSVRTHLVSQFDYSLVDKARLLASTVEIEGGRLYLEFNELDMHEFGSPDGGGYLQLWWANGRTLYRSESLREADLERTAPAADAPLCQWITLPSGVNARAASMIFRPRVDEEEEEEEEGEDEEGLLIYKLEDVETLTLILARDAKPIFAALTPLRVLLVCLGLITIAVCSIVLWIMIRRKLRPLERTAEQIAQLGDQDLSKRIGVERIPQELQPVVLQFNALLVRLEAAFQREREFTGDVAHELRTPLSGLRTTLEVAISQVRGPEEYEGVISDCLKIIEQMQHMTENLLLLTRLESGRVDIATEKVLVNKLIRDVWKSFAEQAQTRQLQVEWCLGLDPQVMTDRSLFALVVRNIMENAVLYADEGGIVRIKTCDEDGRVGIQVSNTGSTLSADLTERVFERYWRGNEARSETEAHCGLGLSLVKKITTVLGGAVEVESNAEGIFRISASLPNP